MQDLEKLYKDKLENHGSRVSEDVWEHISNALSEQKSKRRFYILLIATGLALLLIFGYFIIRDNSESRKTKNTQNKERIYETANSSQNSSETKTTLSGKTQDDNIASKENISSPKERILTPKTNRYTLSSSPAANNNHQLGSNSNSTFVNSITNHENILSKDNHNIAKDISAISISHIDRRDKKNKDLAFDNISIIQKHKIYVTPPQVNTLFWKKHQGILNDCFPVKKSFFFLEMYYSNDYNRKTLTGDNFELSDARNKTESNLYSYSFGLMGGYLLSNGLKLKAGINYTDINEKFNVTFRNVVSTQTIITIDTIKNPDGSITAVRDTTIKEIYGERNIQDNNKYSMIDIPLIMGLNYSKFNHNIGINIGVIFNIISRQKGTILSHNTDTSETLVFESDNNIFHSNTGISIYASLDYSYRLMKRYELFIEPNIRYYLKSFTKDNYALRQNYTKYGISFGGRYFF